SFGRVARRCLTKLRVLLSGSSLSAQKTANGYARPFVAFLQWGLGGIDGRPSCESRPRERAFVSRAAGDPPESAPPAGCTRKGRPDPGTDRASSPSRRITPGKVNHAVHHHVGNRRVRYVAGGAAEVRFEPGQGSASATAVER